MRFHAVVWSKKSSCCKQQSVSIYPVAFATLDTLLFSDVLSDNYAEATLRT